VPTKVHRLGIVYPDFIRDDTRSMDGSVVKAVWCKRIPLGIGIKYLYLTSDGRSDLWILPSKLGRAAGSDRGATARIKEADVLSVGPSFTLSTTFH
jgi:hypothetical protein